MASATGTGTGTGTGTPATGTQTTGTTSTSTTINACYPTFFIPPGIVIQKLDGVNWPAWSSQFLALLRLNGYREHISDANPGNDPLWDIVEDMLLGTFQIYTMTDVWSAVSLYKRFPSCKAKWDELNRIYGAVGFTSGGRPWRVINRFVFDEAKPLLPQFHILNQARRDLQEADQTINEK